MEENIMWGCNRCNWGCGRDRWWGRGCGCGWGRW